MDKNLHLLFGDRIRTLRKSKKYTQEELAFKAGMDVSYLNYIENGKQSPTLNKISSLAKALEVELPELFYFQQSKNYQQQILLLQKKLIHSVKPKDKKAAVVLDEFINLIKQIYFI
jgi:transcriptional regulator with XRE-family HTH domain